MKGDSVCWREDWKALKPDMSCDTQREKEREGGGEGGSGGGQLNSSTEHHLSMLNISVRVFTRTYAFLQCECV